MSKARRTVATVIAAMAGVAVLGLAACGDDDKDTPAAATPPAAESDPLRIEIQAAVVPEFAGTARPTVTFRVLDGAGNPVDLEAELATTAFPNFTSPGRAPAFTLAMLDDNNDYVSYYSTLGNFRDYTYIPDPEVLGSTTEQQVKDLFPPARRTQAQAIAVSRQNLRAVGNRVYQFTFPSPTTNTAQLDRTKPHKVAGWAVRRPNNADQDVGTGNFDFVPQGNAPARTIETVNDGAQSCGRCHGFVQAHGSRRTVQFCITCHSPQTGDPDTNQTVDFKVMIHKIHSGADLPSVNQGKPYFIVGFGQAVHDWSGAAFPWHDHGVRHCTVCHSGKDADNWKTRPTLTACGSCHDNVKFASATGLPTCPPSTQTGPRVTADCLHFGGPITVDNPSSTASCIGCHGPGTAAAVDKYHHGD